MMEVLAAQVHVSEGPESRPSAGSIDSQTVQTMKRSGPRGYDGRKKFNGRKRHVFVNVQGPLLAVLVSSATASSPS